MGSKRKLAKELLPIILKGRRKGQWYVEPFCGGCNTIDKVDGLRMAGDCHFELIEYFKAITSGWIPPKIINEDEYKRIKNDPKALPCLKGYAGFTHSFGGTYFGTYRRRNDESDYKIPAGSPKSKGNYKNINNVGLRAFNSSINQSKLLAGVKFYCCSYYDLPIPPKSIIYCDPPYEGTSKYKVDPFPHSNFWNWCRAKKDEGHAIFISEYNAPKDFKCVWSKDVKENLRSQGMGRVKTEKLFTL